MSKKTKRTGGQPPVHKGKKKIMKNCYKGILSFLLSILIIALSAALVILIFKYNNTVEEKEFLSDNSDAVFSSSFSLLCSNLNSTATDSKDRQYLDEENIKYSYLCFNIFSQTTYCENEDLNSIILSLYNMCLEKSVYNLDPSITEGLLKLSDNLNDTDLAKEIYCNIHEARVKA